MTRRGNYENCRWCNNYEGGSCAADWFTVESDYDGRMMDVVDFIEGGKLSEVVKESIEGTVVNRITDIVESTLSGYRIGKDRRKEIMNDVTDEIREYIEEKVMWELIESLDRSMDNAILGGDELEFYVCPNDETGFVCSEFR